MREPPAAENAAGGGRLDLIGVPFDGMGRAPGQAGAPQALRVAGLPAALGPNVVMEPDLVLPGSVPQRAAGSGLLNELALLQMIGALYRRVRASLSAGRFPSSTAPTARCCSPRFPRCVMSLAGRVWCSWMGTRTPRRWIYRRVARRRTWGSACSRWA